MKKIGITGSLASGKTTASKILSKKRGPLFSADDVVRKFYKNTSFKNKIIKILRISNKTNFKSEVKKKILVLRRTIKKIKFSIFN